MDESGQSLWVPTRQVEVGLALDGRGVRQVELFLPEPRPGTPLREAIFDLFNGANSFLPAREFAEPAGVVFNKDAVVYVEIPLSIDAASTVEEPALAERRDVRVEIAGDMTLDGQLIYAAPPGQARVTDFLNSGGRFFQLWRPQQVYVVNKGFTIRVVELATNGP